jgi:uncharacterized membrane protein
MSRSFKIVLGVLGGIVLVLVLLPVFATSGLFDSGSMMGQGNMMGQDGMMSAGDWIEAVAWTILGFVVLAVVLWAVFRILPSPWPDSVGSDRREGSAEETLRQRFARGEIDAKDYEQRHRVLREESPAAHR